MKDILIAGCGHGGLVCGAILAKNGYNVSIYEKKKEEDLGHDWEDRFTFSLLARLIGKTEDELDKDAWRFRGDCAFLSPSQKTKVEIFYTDETRQKIMWRKPLLKMLIAYAKSCGVQFHFETEVKRPIIQGDFVKGFVTNKGEVFGDMVIDAQGVFSSLRTQLPEKFHIEKEPKYGDLFYGYRAYFNRLEGFETSKTPFEVYLYHECEQGLSWHCTNDDTVDILIGRIYPLNQVKVEDQLSIFREKRPWTGDKIIHGGQYGIIPVRRPLTKMVAGHYACVGDSAFMTTPMNGMGIDLSLHAGEILANVIMSAKDYSQESLWTYNKQFHQEFGGDTAKNEGLKNALLRLPAAGVDFLFDHEVIQSSDLAGAGKNMSFTTLLKKFVNGMKKPAYFFAIIKGLIKGSKASKLYKKAPKKFNEKKVQSWTKKIENCDIRVI